MASTPLAFAAAAAREDVTKEVPSALSKGNMSNSTNQGSHVHQEPTMQKNMGIWIDKLPPLETADAENAVKRPLRLCKRLCLVVIAIWDMVTGGQ